MTANFTLEWFLVPVSSPVSSFVRIKIAQAPCWPIQFTHTNCVNMSVWTLGNIFKGGMNPREKSPELEARGQSASLREVDGCPSCRIFSFSFRQVTDSVLLCRWNFPAVGKKGDISISAPFLMWMWWGDTTAMDYFLWLTGWVVPLSVWCWRESPVRWHSLGKCTELERPRRFPLYVWGLGAGHGLRHLILSWWAIDFHMAPLFLLGHPGLLTWRLKR